MYFCIVAVAFHLVVAAVVWSGAGVLALFAATRPLAKRLAVAMVGSFPGVLLSQLLCAPLVAALVAVAAIHPAALDRLPDWAGDALAVVSVVVPALAALWGFVVGWRVAWQWPAGRAWRRSLESTEVLGSIWRRLVRLE